MGRKKKKPPIIVRLITQQTIGLSLDFDIIYYEQRYEMSDGSVKKMYASRVHGKMSTPSETKPHMDLPL
jgi:hypothetical protein